MRPSVNRRSGFIFQFLILSLLMFFLTSATAFSLSDGHAYKLKESYKIKRTSDGTVSLYSRDSKDQEISYVFTDFNADVLLLVYRRIDMNSMVNSLARKYYMSRTDARRSVKMALNELMAWDLIIRD